MKKAVAFIVVLAIILSVGIVSVYAENTKSDKPAFERRGLSSRTLNVTENNKRQVPFDTGKNSDLSKTSSGFLTAEWVTVFDPNTGYSENGTDFYIPEGLFVDNVTFTGGSEILSNIEGYEWRCIRIEYNTIDSYDSAIINTFEDYYTLQQYDIANSKSIITYEDKDSGDGFIAFNEYSLEINGKNYNKCFLYWDYTHVKNQKTDINYLFVRVPQGYDGCVFGFVDTRGKAKGDDTSVAEGDDVPRGAGDVYFRLK